MENDLLYSLYRKIFRTMYCTFINFLKQKFLNLKKSQDIQKFYFDKKKHEINSYSNF